MNDSVFDPQTFLNAEVEGAMETQVEQLNDGEYKAVIDNIEPRTFERKDGTGYVHMLNVTFKVIELPPEKVERLGRENPTVRFSTFLDVNEAGQLEMGKNKNVGLGRLREAVGQNDPSRPWKPGDLIGAGPVIIRVGAQQNNPEYKEVKQVAPLA